MPDGWDALRAVALAAQAGDPFQLALLDWQLPGMDGIARAEQLLARAPATRPVVMMTTAFGRDELTRRIEAAARPRRFLRCWANR